MTAELFIARYMGISLVIVGLSHLLRPAQWVAMFRTLEGRSWAGLLLAALYLPQGLIIILGHNVWVWGLPVIVTVLGWGMSLKGTLYLLIPELPLRAISADFFRERGFRVAGAVALILGAAISYDAFLR